MKKIMYLILILSFNAYAADEDGSGGTPSSSASSTVDEEGSGGHPYSVVVNGNTTLHCYANGSCIVISN
jgi:hypothetical protein